MSPTTSANSISTAASGANPTTAAQELVALRAHLHGRIAELRQEYAGLSASIAATLAAGTSRRGKPKLNLPLPELAAHMQQREARAAAQHQLLLLVPVMRLVIAAVQQQGALVAKSGRKLPDVAQLIAMHCAGALRHAKPEVTQLFKGFPALLSHAVPGAAPATTTSKVNAEKAQALHAKLLASGLLTSDEVVTLRKVFAQYQT
jgi:hypothetical protein